MTAPWGGVPGWIPPRPGPDRTPDGAGLRRLLSIVALAAVVLSTAGWTVAILLSGRVDSDLAIVPAARGAEAVALLAGLTIAIAVVAVIRRGRRWLHTTRPAFSPQGSNVGRPKRTPLSALTSQVPAPTGGAWYERGVDSSTWTARIAISLSAGGLLLVTLGLVGTQVTSDLASARSAWLAVAVGAILLSLGATLARWLIGDVERRVRAVRRLGDPTAPETGPPEPRWSRIAAAIAGLAIGIVVGASSVSVLAAADDVPCLSTALECRTLVVPADHLVDDPRGDARIISYGLHRATGERLGTMVIVPGGPGVAGVPTWEFDYEWLDERLLAAYDIVALDPRGTGGSGGVDCPSAWESFARSLSFEADASLITTFVDTCLVETGVEPEELPRYGGAHVVGDIEAIREDLGVDRIALYGESYGTATATRYAMTHPERLSALILDAPLDVTQDFEAFWAESATGFETALDRTFEWCRGDAGCASELADPEQAWDRLHVRLMQGPLKARYAGTDGVVREWPIDRTDSIAAFAAAMYTEHGRMLAMRALAAAERDDLVPLARMIHPAEATTDSVVVDSAFGYAAALCADRVDVDVARGPAAFLAWAEDAGSANARMGHVVLSAAICSAWPVPASEPPATTLPVGLDAPVVILTSTGDPVTPASIGRRLADRWSGSADVYRIETTGGPHVTFARRDHCIDAPVIGLLVDGDAPARVTRCDGEVATAYEGVVRRSADTDGLVLRALALDDELYNHPQYAAWYRVGTLTVGCRHGGTISVTFAGLTEHVVIEGCAVLPDEPIDGSGAYYHDGSFRYDATSARGRWRYDADATGADIVGTFDGIAVEESW